MKIAICEDDEFWIESLLTSVSQWAKIRNIELSCCKFYSPQTLIKFLLNKTDIDVVFLDISFVIYIILRTPNIYNKFQTDS